TEFNMSKEKFTQGPILGSLVKFTLPIFFSMLLQSLYGAVDVIVVGQFSLPDSISAVTTGSQFIHMILMLIAGLCVGTTVVIGQKIGAQKPEEARDVIGSTIWLYTIITILFTFVMVFFAPHIARRIQTPPEAFKQTVKYIRISGYGVVFLIAYNVFGAVFRGFGDSKTPLIAVIIATVLNILGDLLLVAVCNMGAVGAAIATVFAQAVSVGVSLFIVQKRGFSFSRKNMVLNSRIVIKILKFGAPVAIQNGLIQISFLAITAIVNTLGVIISAGVGITERMISFLMLSQMSFGEALSSFSAHNVGAKKYSRAKKGLFYTLFVSISIGTLIACLAFFYGDVLLKVFTRDKAVLAVSYEYLKAYSFDVVSTAILFCFVGYFNGLGKTRFVMWQGIIGSIMVRIPLSYIFAQQIPVSLFKIGLAIPISSFLEDILCIVYFFIVQKKLKDKESLA
ncbi:MAG TPA: MATE family efflux transporter, partial [Treponemataceae bacterium]|nr:MATE family efflux transporter [Treponemataceae bacterium]